MLYGNLKDSNDVSSWLGSGLKHSPQKVMVVDAIRSLCLKYPQKHRTLINFLSNVLREEGGFEFKKVCLCFLLSSECGTCKTVKARFWP